MNGVIVSHNGMFYDGCTCFWQGGNIIYCQQYDPSLADGQKDVQSVNSELPLEFRKFLGISEPKGVCIGDIGENGPSIAEQAKLDQVNTKYAKTSNVIAAIPEPRSFMAMGKISYGPNINSKYPKLSNCVY